MSEGEVMSEYAPSRLASLRAVLWHMLCSAPAWAAVVCGAWLSRDGQWHEAFFWMLLGIFFRIDRVDRRG